jgi:hypothetical protein
LKLSAGLVRDSDLVADAHQSRPSPLNQAGPCVQGCTVLARCRLKIRHITQQTIDTMLSTLPLLCSRSLVGAVGGVAVAARNAAEAWATSAAQQPTASISEPVRSFSTPQAPADNGISLAYGLSEEQENMFALAREFAKEKMLPHAAAWEEDKASSNRL